MKHLVAILVDSDTSPHRVKISHHKDFFFDSKDAQRAGETIKKDIDTMATGIVAAIRAGGELNVLNKPETLARVIQYLQSNISIIDVYEGHSIEDLEAIKQTTTIADTAKLKSL